MRKKIRDSDEKRRKIFVAEYVLDWNGTRAALAAGYGPKENTAATQASELIRIPEVKAAIDEAFRERVEELGSQARDVYRELEYIAFSRITDILQWDADGVTTFVASDNLSPAHRAAIAEFNLDRYVDAEGNVTVKMKIKQHPKLEALDKLARLHGLYKDRVEVEHSLAPIFILPEEEKGEPNGRGSK